jgi:trigger factor
MKGGESWKEGQDVVVEMTYEALPEIPDVDVTKVKLEKLVVKAEDKAVAEALENLPNRPSPSRRRRRAQRPRMAIRW